MPSQRSKKSASKGSGHSTGPVTRAKSGSAPAKDVDLAYYTTIREEPTENDGAGSGFQVVSKRPLKSDPKNHERLEASLAKVKQWEKNNAARSLPPSFNKRSVYLATHVNIFLYATCFFIQLGTLPYLTQKLGADPVVFGYLQTAAALTQLVGGPIYGRLGDMMGARAAMILAFSSASISYFLMGIATSIHVLFVSRLFSVFMHAMQGSQMIVTFLSDEKERTAALAKLGFFYGMGIVVGPSLGGMITKHFGEQSSALLASAVSVVSVFIVLAFIPHTPKKRSETRAISVFNVRKILELVFQANASFLFLVKLIVGVPMGILESMLSVIAMEQFGLAPDRTGMVISYIGVISMSMQGFGIGAVTSRFSDKSILKFSILTLTLAYVILALVRDLQDFLMLLLPLTCSMCLINSVMTSSLTKKAKEDSSGQMLGLNMAVHSIIRSFAPSVGSLLVVGYGVWSLGVVGICSCSVTMVLIPFLKLQAEPPRR